MNASARSKPPLRENKSFTGRGDGFAESRGVQIFESGDAALALPSAGAGGFRVVAPTCAVTPDKAGWRRASAAGRWLSAPT